MGRDDVKVDTILDDLKIVMHEVKECKDEEEISVLFYGMFRALKDLDKDVTLEEALQYSKDRWSDLYG